MALWAVIILVIFYQLHGSDVSREFVERRMVLNDALRESLISSGVKPQREVVSESREEMEEDGYSWLMLKWSIRIQPELDLLSARNMIEKAIVAAHSRPVVTWKKDDNEIPLKIDAYVGNRLSHRIVFVYEPTKESPKKLRIGNSPMVAKRWIYLSGKRLKLDRKLQQTLSGLNLNGPPLLISEYWEKSDSTYPIAHWIISIDDSWDVEKLARELEAGLSDDVSVWRAIGLEKAKTKLALKVAVDGNVSHLIVFTSHPDNRGINNPGWKKEDDVYVTAPRAAIIIDDIGYDIGIADRLMSLGVPLTLSVLPRRPHSTEIALRARKRNVEIMLHLPMEPVSYPRTDPGFGAIMLRDSKAEQKRKTEEDLDSIPYVTGVNNHMGSGAMVDSQTVKNVLGVIKEHGMFFVDSRTTAKTLGFITAQALHIPTAERSVFIDSTEPVDVGYRIRMLREVIRISKEQGSCIAIGHPSHDTLNAIKQMIDEFREQGVELVYVSDLVTGQIQ